MIRRTVVTLAGAVLALASIPAPASGATRTVCPSGCDFDTIQAGVTAADPGDTIEVAAGTYAESVAVAKPLTIAGAGADATTVQANTVFDLQNGSSGTTLRDLTIRGTAVNSGRGVTVTGTTVDDVMLANLTITNTRWGIEALTNQSLDGWTIDNVTATANNIGARFRGVTTNLVIQDSHFDRNDMGIVVEYRQTTPREPAVFDGIDVDSTTFNANAGKGLYLEAVSNAVFTDVQIDGTGSIPPVRDDPDAYPKAGVDINVKYGAFAGVAFNDVRVTNTVGTGLAIKGRNDGSYAAQPATLTDVTLTGMTITGTRATAHPEAAGHGVAFGNNVVDARVTGSRIVDNEGGGVLSYVTSGSTIDATNTWWGCNAGPGGAGCDSATVAPGAAPIATDPRVVLGLSTPGGVAVGGIVPVTASVATNSAGGPVAGLPEQPIGLAATAGALSSSGGVTSGGVLTTAFTGTSAGFAVIAATLDNETTTAGVNVFVPAPAPEPAPQPAPPAPPVTGEEQSVSPPPAPRTPAEQAQERAGQILGGAVTPAGFRLGGLAQVFRPAGSRIAVPRNRRTPVMAVGCEAVECQVAVKVVLRLRDGTRIVLPVQRSGAARGQAVSVVLRLTAKQRRQLRRAGGATMRVEVRVNGNGERATSRRSMRVG
jgi:hypothetical protein